MSETATQIPITAIIPMLMAIGDRSWEQFKALEINFAQDTVWRFGKMFLTFAYCQH